MINLHLIQEHLNYYELKDYCLLLLDGINKNDNVNDETTTIDLFFVEGEAVDVDLSPIIFEANLEEYSDVEDFINKFKDDAFPDQYKDDEE